MKNRLQNSIFTSRRNENQRKGKGKNHAEPSFNQTTKCYNTVSIYENSHERMKCSLWATLSAWRAYATSFALHFICYDSICINFKYASIIE